MLESHNEQIPRRCANWNYTPAVLVTSSGRIGTWELYTFSRFLVALAVSLASFALSLESPATLLSYALLRKDYNLPEDYWDTYPTKIAALTSEDIQRVAQKYLTLENIQIVAVGDATKVKPSLEKYGKVMVYDQMPSLGRKFLMAGRGGLNLTHSEDLATFLTRYGDIDPLLRGAIEAFPPTALRAWSDSLGQPTFVGSSGRVFPTVLKTSPLLRTWLLRLGNLGVTFKLRHRWEGWDEEGSLRFTSAGQDVSAEPDATVLALAGMTRLNFTINADGTLVYKGAIDSIRSAEVSDIAKATNYVKVALDALKSEIDALPERTRLSAILRTRSGVLVGRHRQDSGTVADAQMAVKTHGLEMGRE